MSPFVKILITSFFILALSAENAKADHCAGGELLYECLHDSTYKVTLKFYRDCSGIQAYNDIPMCAENTCNGAQFFRTLKKADTLPGGRPNGSQISTGGCPGYPNQCDDPNSLIPGFTEWWYVDSFVLPARCKLWNFSVSISARNFAVNIGGASLFHVRATLNNDIAQGNTSPSFSVKPVPYTILGGANNYNNGVFDKDGDSLVFRTVIPLGGSGCNGIGATLIPKTPPLNLVANPFQTNNTYTLDPMTGQMRFVPGELGKQTIAIKAEEYRNNVLIGSVMRDIQIQVLPGSPDTCAFNVVKSSLVNCMMRGSIIYACVGVNMQFCYDIVSSNDSTVIVATDNHTTSHPASNVSYTGQTTDSIRGCFSLLTSINDVGLKNLLILEKDSTCKPPGIALYQVFSVPIYISTNSSFNPPTIVSPVYYCQYDAAVPLKATGTGILWYDTLGGVVGRPNPPIPSTDSIGVKKYFVQANNSCLWEWATIYVHVVPKAEAVIKAEDTLCIFENLTIANTKHKAGISYTWSLDSAKILSNDSDRVLVVNWKTKGLKKVRLYASNSTCNQTDSMYVYVTDSLSSARFELPDSICAGVPVNIKTLNNNKYYFWYIEDNKIYDTVYTNPIIVWKSGGIKTVRLYTKSAGGCYSYPYEDSLLILHAPIAGISFGSQELCLGDELTLSTHANATYTYSWQPSNIFNSSNQPEAVIPHLRENKVILTVTNPDGCTTTDSVYMTPPICCRIALPDAFTPNNDGRNDIYRPIAVKDVENYNFIIVNRWGQVIYQSNNTADGWDGTFKNEVQEAGTYHYLVTYKCTYGSDKMVKKGSLTLIK